MNQRLPKRLTRLVGTAPLLALLAAALPVAATASPLTARTRASVTNATVDQEQTVFSGGLSVRTPATQNVVAGRHGPLTRVDIPLCAPIQGSTVELSVQDLPVKHSNKVTSAALVLPQSLSDCAWYTFTFKTPNIVRVGEALRLIVRSTGGEAPLWGSDATGGNPYPAGTGTWMGHAVDAFAFRTYIATDGPG